MKETVSESASLTAEPVKKGSNVGKAIAKGVAIFFTVLLLLVVTLFGICFVAFKGPSNAAKQKVTTSTLEMSAAKWVPHVFLSQEEIDAIVESNKVVETDATTDTSLVNVVAMADISGATSGNSEAVADDEWKDYPEGIRIEKIKGGTYRAYVMLIRDPSRVYVGTSSKFNGNAPGLRILEAVEREGAVAAINGGGFPDAGGVGNGAEPVGIVISKGEHLYGGMNSRYTAVAGITNNGVLVVGNLTPKECLDMGVRDALCFGPILMVNGEPAQISGANGSLNPRTAIGQRADGTIIFVCVDGRMPSSPGATYADLIDIFVEYGAVNALNLDGGSSTHMVYNGELVNVSSSLYGPRRMPTFFMVRPLDENKVEGGAENE